MGAFSGRPLIVLELIIDSVSSTPNTSTIAWTLRARETSSQPSYALNLRQTSSVNFFVSGGGTITSSSANGAGYTLGTTILWNYDFRPSGLQTRIIATGSIVVTHNSSGAGGTVSGLATANDLDGNLGSASADFTPFGLTDFVYVPTTPSVTSFSRGSNGTTISLTSSNATFYGSGAYYQYRWSYDNSNWSGENSMSGTSGSGSGFVNTNTIWVQVRAGDSEGVSGWSASSSGIEGVPAAPGAAPTLTRTADGTSITLTSAPATRATAYSYRQSTDGVNWGGTVNISSGTSVTITGLVYDQIYYYQTLGRNGTGSGAWSATRSIAGAAPSFSGSGTDTTVASPAIWGLPYTDGVTALRVRNYSVVPNTLPAGLSLNTGTGAITGTPTSTTTFSSTFTITANNNAGTATTSATIAVISPVRVASATGPTGSLVTGAVNVNTATGPTASFKTGIVRVWNGSTFVPSRLA
jgi:hypothetical protein